MHSGERRSENKKESAGHREQGGNWSRWISEILPRSLRQVSVVVVVIVVVFLSVSACLRKSSFLFIHELGDARCAAQSAARKSNVILKDSEDRIDMGSLDRRHTVETLGR